MGTKLQPFFHEAMVDSRTGRSCQINLPAGIPHYLYFTIFDFSLWAYIKDKICFTLMHSVSQIKCKTLTAAQTIGLNIVQNLCETYGNVECNNEGEKPKISSACKFEEKL